LFVDTKKGVTKPPIVAIIERITFFVKTPKTKVKTVTKNNKILATKGSIKP